MPIAQARWTSVCLPLPRVASPVPWSWGTLEWHPYCGWEENHDDVSSCLQTGKLVSSLLPNNEADRRDLHIWKQSGRKLFCSTFTYLPSSASARGTSPVPCCWAAWLCAAWAQSMRWEMTWRRGQTPVSPVHTSGFHHLLSSSLTTKQLRLAGMWLLMASGEELHPAHHTSTISLSLQFTRTGDLPKFKCLPAACLFLNSWVIFPKQIKADMALLCVWIIMWPRELKAQHAAYTSVAVVVVI